MIKAFDRVYMLIAVCNWIAFTDPIGAEVVWEVEHLHFGKAHLAQFCECGSEVWAAIQGAATAIEHNELLARERIYAILELLDAGRLRGWSYVFRTGDVRLIEEHV